MTTPTQGELRSWARSQGIAVGDRGSLPAAVKTAYAAAHGQASAGAQGIPPVVASRTPSPPGDLAAGLRDFLEAVDTEVRAVSALSERIDGIVADLNGLRDQQARRLAVLDELQATGTDPGLAAFLKKVINPKLAQTHETVPARLR